jgi:hypothetical protein
MLQVQVQVQVPGRRQETRHRFLFIVSFCLTAMMNVRCKLQVQVLYKYIKSFSLCPFTLSKGREEEKDTLQITSTDNPINQKCSIILLRTTSTSTTRFER